MTEDDMNKIYVEKWFESRSEIDRNILLFSALGIGLFATFEPGGSPDRYFWLASNLFFMAAIILIFIVFYKNGNYIKSLINKSTQEEKKESKRLDWLSYIAYSLFAFGVMSGTAFVIINKFFINNQ